MCALSFLDVHQEITVCDGETQTLSCPDGLVLAISGAFYGWLNNTTCVQHHGGTHSNCSHMWATNIVSQKCLRKQQCDITADIATFGGDLCPGISKHAQINYDCFDGKFGVANNISLLNFVP